MDASLRARNDIELRKVVKREFTDQIAGVLQTSCIHFQVIESSPDQDILRSSNFPRP